MPPQEHPIWRILNVLVIFVGITTILYFNANSFDHTELSAIIQIVLGVVAYEAFKHTKAIPQAAATKKTLDKEGE